MVEMASAHENPFLTVEKKHKLALQEDARLKEMDEEFKEF
jgi:hypothetical protein